MTFEIKLFSEKFGYYIELDYHQYLHKNGKLRDDTLYKGKPTGLFKSKKKALKAIKRYYKRNNIC